MSSDDTEFTPNQVERQIDLLARDQEGQVHAFSDARLISDLYQAHTENRAIVESVWQRLSMHMESTRPLAAIRNDANAFLQQQERPQGMEITVTNKRPPRPITRLLETCAAILIVAALLAGTVFVLNHARQALTASTKVATSSGLYVRTPHRVSHWDLASGKVLWNYNTGQQETVLGDIYVVDNVVIFQIYNNSSVSETVGVDASTGQQLWTQTQQTQLETVSDGVVISSTTSYASRSGGMYKSPISTITAYQATTGQQLWSYKFAPTSNPQPVTGVVNQFASAQGVLYINSSVQRIVQGAATTSLPEQVIAVSIASGRQIWQKAIDSGARWLVADGKNLYLFGTTTNGEKGTCIAINGANGNQIWQTTIAGNISHYTTTPLSPTVANGILYIDSTGQGEEYSPHIYTYDTSNGTLLKDYALASTDGFSFSPLVIDNLVFYRRSIGKASSQYPYNWALGALDIKTWQPAWSVYVGPTSSLEPQIVNDIIYVPSGNNLLAYTTSGKLLHSYQTQTTADANWNFTVVA